MEHRNRTAWNGVGKPTKNEKLNKRMSAFGFGKYMGKQDKFVSS